MIQVLGEHFKSVAATIAFFPLRLLSSEFMTRSVQIEILSSHVLMVESEIESLSFRLLAYPGDTCIINWMPITSCSRKGPFSGLTTASSSVITVLSGTIESLF